MGMERTVKPIAFQSFRGLNTKLSQISISPREASSMKNHHLTQETLQTRNGNSIFTTTQFIEGGEAKAVTGLFQGVLGSTVVRLATAGSKVYSISSAGVKSDITGAFSLTDDPDLLTHFAVFKDASGNDIVVGGNGIDNNWKWTGAGNIATLGGSPPGDLKNLLVYKNRLWGTDGDFAYHSEIFDGEDWDPVNYVIRIIKPGFSTNDITRLIEFGDNLCLFKERGIWMFSGENATDGYMQGVVTEDGTISPMSVIEIPSRRFGNIIVFVNRNLEIKGFDGTKNLIHISDPIDGDLNEENTGRAPYVSAAKWNKYKEYVMTLTESGASTHNKIFAYDYSLDGFDGDPEGKNPRESTMLPFEGITASFLDIWDLSGRETLMSGTYDGWILKHDIGARDVVHASQINSSGASRTSNVVTITTDVEHEFEIGETVVISGVTDTGFNGTFEVASTPTSTSFTYAQTASDASSGNGIARSEAQIDSLWEGKKNNYGNAAHLKQLNDMNTVTVSQSGGSIRVTVSTEQGVGTKEEQVAASGAIYGAPTSIYGATIGGGSGEDYTRFELDMGSGLTALYGRYFKFKFENVDGFIYGLEEFIPGITDDGYQADYAA